MMTVTLIVISKYKEKNYIFYHSPGKTKLPNPLTPNVTFDSMERTLKCDHSLEISCCAAYIGSC